MIKSIHLKNWKVHSDTTIDFSKGVNILLGIMGAGKSSIIDAISFALFGTFPALNSGRVKLEELISNTNPNLKEASVTLVFDVNNVDYSVTRKINKKKGADALIEKDGKYLQTQPKRVNEEIESLLKIDYDTFIKAIYAEQNKLDSFLNMRKGERKKGIDEMLGLDHFSSVEENTTSVIGMINRVLKEDEQILNSSNITALKEQLQKLSLEKEETSKKIDKLKKDYAINKSNLIKLNESLKKIKLELDNKNKLNNELTNISSKIETLKSEVSKIPEIKEEGIQDLYNSKKLKVNEISIKLDELRKEQINLTKEIATANSEIKSNQKRLEDNEKIESQIKELEKENIKEKLEGKSKEIENLNIKIASNEGVLKETSNWLVELKKDISKCPVCDRDIDTDLKVKLIKEKEEQILVTKKAISDDKELLKNTKSENDILNLKKNKLEVLKEKLEDTESINKIILLLTKNSEKNEKELANINASIDENVKEIDTLRKEIKSIEEKVESIKREQIVYSNKEKSLNDLYKRRVNPIEIEADISKSKDSIEKNTAKLNEINSNIKTETEILDKIRDEIKAIEEKIEYIKRRKTINLEIQEDTKKLKAKKDEFDKITVSQEQLEKVQSDYNEVYSKVNSIKVEYESDKKYFNSLVSQISDKLEQITRIEETSERTEKRRKMISQLEKFKTAIIETESGLREKLITSVNEVMYNLWPEIYPYTDYQSILLKVYKDDYNLEGIIIRDGKEKTISIDSFASGGERSVASLTLRIALGMVIVPNLKWIILDEPTHNLDSAGINKLISIFSETLPNIVEQIFIITHDENLKSVHFAKIYELERDKSTNNPTQILEL